MLSKKQLIIILAWMIIFPEIFVRLVYSITIIPITQFMHITYFLSSIILASFYIGYSLANLPFGYLVDRYGFKIVAISLIFLAIFMFLFSFSKDFLEAFILMFLMGVVSSPTYIGAVKLVSLNNNTFKATAISVLNTVGPFTLLISNFIVPSMLEKIEWQWIYFYSSILTIIISLPLFFLKFNVSKDLKKGAINKKSVLSSFVRFFSFWGMWGVSSYLYLLVHTHFNTNLILSGLISGVFSLGGLIAIPISGLISDVFSKRKEITLLFLISFFLFLIIFPFLPENYIYFFSFLLGFLAFGYRSPLDTYISEITKGREATSMGLANMISQPSSIIVPIIIGYVLTFTGNVTIAFLSLSIGPLIAIFLIQFLD